MKEVKLKFYPVSKRPSKSGWLIVRLENENISVTHFSSVNNQFNNFDELEKDTDENNYELLFPIKYWAYCDDLEEGLNE